MRYFTAIALVFAFSVLVSAQAPVSQIEGFLEVYHTDEHPNSKNLFIGYKSGQNIVVDGSVPAGVENTFVGSESGFSNLTGTSNSFFGSHAGRLNNFGFSNSFFGSHTGTMNTEGNFNSFFGSHAGYKNSADDNSFFGSDAGRNNTTGQSNSYFGRSAGEDNNGSQNSHFGALTTGGSIGSENSFFGYSAGAESFNGKNSFFGASAGLNIGFSINNTFLGARAGEYIDSGSNTICIGALSGPPNLGGTVSTSNQLYIDIEATDSPLIYGEFDNELIQINGQHEIIASNTTTDGALISSYAGYIDNLKDSGDGLAIKLFDMTADADDNFIGFFNGNNTLIGQIEGDGAAVEYKTTGADYAEYLEAQDHSVSFAAGDVVGVNNGKISFNTSNADQVMVISTNPGVVGNTPYPSQDNWYKVAFIGQAKTRTIGKVNSGDFIVPSGNNDGLAIAISPDKIQAQHLNSIIGKAWQTNQDESVKLINVAVGLDNTASLTNRMKNLERELAELKQMFQALTGETMINQE